MTFDPTAPKELIEMQKWFAKVITRPLSAQKPPQFEQEASRYITEGRSLKPHQRIEIYQEQYWLRLLEIMQKNFPLLTRILGAACFNEEIAEPYLLQDKMHSPFLFTLGENLSEWITAHSTADDAPFLSTSAKIDFTIQKIHLAHEPLKFTFELPYDLFSFRDALLAEPVEYWSTHLFPEMAYGTFRFLIYRNDQNKVVWEKI